MSSESTMIANERLDDSLIRESLHENPDFFTRNDDLPTQLQVQHSEKGAVPLIDRQQQTLR